MKKKGIYIFILIILVFIILFSITIGSVDIKFIDVCKIIGSKIPILNNYINLDNIKNSHELIVLQIRLPRIILCALVGIGLSASGSIYQGILKNNMADPYILGISSGASLGATIAIITGGKFDIRIMAFIFALIVTFFNISISKKATSKNSIFIILSGININFLLSAIISLLMILNRNQLEKVLFWTMGSFSFSNWDNVFFALLIIPLVAILSMFGKSLNAISLDETTAKSIGVNTELLRKILIIITSLVTAICVSVSGIIGFVGLMIPHIIRITITKDYRYLVTLSGLIGAIFLIFADNISRTIIAPTEIPIGIITSIIGAPLLLILILKINKELI